jgi:integrase
MPRISRAYPRSPRTPSYRRHKPTGQAVVTLNGRDIYLGKWNSRASRAEYDRLMGEWLSAGRCLPKSYGGRTDLTVAELCLAYWDYCKAYYSTNGKPTGSVDRVKQAIRSLRTAYGPSLAQDFGPLALQAIQRDLASGDRCRRYINYLIDSIRRVFKWAVSQELLPVAVYQALATVPGLRKGRSPARESKPVQPVAAEVVEATLRGMPAIVADMVRLHQLVGARPGEICLIRPCDVDTSGTVWRYRPASHKTEDFGRERVIFVGPRGQAVLRPYLLREKTAYCFVPAESERKRNAQRRENRRTPMTPSQARRRPKRYPKRAPGERYTTGSYHRAVVQAVTLINRERTKEAKKAGVVPELLPRWTPNQLRHSVATAIRRQFGLEAAQVVLGHSRANVTQIYAERDMNLAAEIMRTFG